jgi:hypothetical protein
MGFAPGRGGAAGDEGFTRRRGDAEIMALAEAQRRGEVDFCGKAAFSSHHRALRKRRGGDAASPRKLPPPRLCASASAIISASPRLRVNPSSPAAPPRPGASPMAGPHEARSHPPRPRVAARAFARSAALVQVPAFVQPVRHRSDREAWGDQGWMDGRQAANALPPMGGTWLRPGALKAQIEASAR